MGVKVVHRPPPLAPRLAGGIPETMRKAAAYLRSSADRKIKNGVPPPNAPLTAAVKRGNQTLRDSGNLARSIASHSGATWADASTREKQARLLQEGGTIRPKRARALMLPAGPMTRTLMKRYGAHTPRDLFRLMEIDGYTFFRRKKVYMAKKGKRGKEFALFIVRMSVTIPARPFLYIDGRDAAYLFNLVVGGIKQALQKKEGGNG
jgi:phage gpG-like protein